MEGRFGAWRPPGGPALADLEKLNRAVMAFAGKTPRTRVEIQEFISDHLPPSAAKDERLQNWFSWAAVATSGLVGNPRARTSSTGARPSHRTAAEAAEATAAGDRIRARRPQASGAFGARDRVGHRDVEPASACRISARRWADEGSETIRRRAGPRAYRPVTRSAPPADIAAPPRFCAVRRCDPRPRGAGANAHPPGGLPQGRDLSAEVMGRPSSSTEWSPAGGRSPCGPKEAVLELKPFKPLGRADRAALVARVKNSFASTRPNPRLTECGHDEALRRSARF